MWGFSKKKFFITLGLSTLIWIISAIIQAFIEAPKYIAFFTQSKCSATGYPITECVQNIPEIFIYLINITFWFWAIHLFWGFFNKKR